MMKKCGICDSSLNFVKFKYSEGFICKNCYKIASRNFTETISQKSYSELYEICHDQKQNDQIDEDFTLTGKIANFILFDDKNRKFCLPMNRILLKKHKKPEIYNYDDVTKCEFVCSPVTTMDELNKLESYGNSDQVIKAMNVNIYLKSQKKKIEISIFSTPVRIKSYAFKRSFAFAKRIMNELNRISEKI